MNKCTVRNEAMSRWREESAFLTRYAGSGALNTLVGFSVIFLLMALGVSPFIANIGGYVVGFAMGFALSKKFVFRSNGHFVVESIRYLIAFLLCFALNFLVLRLTLTLLHWNVVFAQFGAAATYTLSMYLLSRWFVFGVQ
ncbi:GtrA-like protein [mine drainage metagenome]|uniref:GtrA-like protein n=1 Tax=mine drainage metagenome TaxID=410659 RepID=A0A1J5SRU4_9ZZZZ